MKRLDYLDTAKGICMLLIMPVYQDAYEPLIMFA